jgi:hypothetical protein
VTPFDQHVARGGVLRHKVGLRLMGARGNRLEHGAHRVAAMADSGGSAGTRAREEVNREGFLQATSPELRAYRSRGMGTKAVDDVRRGSS